MQRKYVLYIVIPAYNEEKNIRELIKEWYPVIERHDGDGSSRLVIVNDGSKDSTGDILDELCLKYPMLLHVEKPNGGHGSAVLCGYRFALENGADYIFQTDSDRQTNPAEFEGFWKKKDKYDAVIGMRPDRQDGKGRVFVEKVLVFLLFLFFGVRVPDSNAPFRLMKRELLARYIKKLPKDFNLPNVMFTTYFAYFKENVAFRRITFKPRTQGKNSINIKSITRIGFKALFDFVKLRRDIERDSYLYER